MHALRFTFSPKKKLRPEITRETWENLILRGAQINLLIGKCADLESEIVSLRADLALKTEEAAKLKKQIDISKKAEQYDVSSGIAFKRGKKKGEYENTPYCPTCHKPLSQGPISLFCDPCKYHPGTPPHVALKALLEKQ